MPGFGTASLAAFQALVARHDAARAARPETVGAKANALTERQKRIEEGWTFVERAVGALSAVAIRKPGVAEELNAAVPADAGALPAGILTLAGLIRKHLADLDPEFDGATRAEGAEALSRAVEDQVTAAARAKEATVIDTREIDLLDGQVVTTIRQVNKAGRKAFKRAGNDVKARTYQLVHLAHAQAKPKAEPTPPPAG